MTTTAGRCDAVAARPTRPFPVCAVDAVTGWLGRVGPEIDG